jgi:hypothetical protein
VLNFDFQKNFRSSRRSLLPVPVALALSLTFVYLAAGNFDPSDLARDDSDILNEQCTTAIAHLPESEVTASEQVAHPCPAPDKQSTGDNRAELWPRLKTRPPRT